MNYIEVPDINEAAFLTDNAENSSRDELRPSNENGMRPRGSSILLNINQSWNSVSALLGEDAELNKPSTSFNSSEANESRFIKRVVTQQRVIIKECSGTIGESGEEAYLTFSKNTIAQFSGVVEASCSASSEGECKTVENPERGLREGVGRVLRRRRLQVNCSFVDATFTSYLRLNQCYVCFKIFATRSILERHFLVHCDERPFECKECLQTFKMQHHLKMHVQRKHLAPTSQPKKALKNAPQPKPNSNVPKSRRRKSNFGTKKKSTAAAKHNCKTPKAVPKNRKASAKTKKNKSLSASNVKKGAQKKVTRGQKKVTFKQKKVKMSKSAQKTSQKKTKACECPICFKTLSTPWHLKRHIHTVHKEKQSVTKVQCTECLQMFSNKDCLQKHQEKHINDRMFHCNLCEEVFNISGDLDTHRDMHYEKEPYECKYCCKRFMFSSILSLHEDKHTAEEDDRESTNGCSSKIFDTSFIHVCRECGRIFTTSHSFVAHLREHNSTSNP